METRTITFGGWTWTNSIGLMYGTGPDGERETVSRPLMSSPWWTIGDPDPLEGSTSHSYPDGFFSPIFNRVGEAVRHVSGTRRAPLVVDPNVSYEVWERDLRSGETKRWDGNPAAGMGCDIAGAKVEQFNKAQDYLDRYEDGPTREFFIVKTTTTYEVYDG